MLSDAALEMTELWRVLMWMHFDVAQINFATMIMINTEQVLDSWVAAR
jgi:hypothetical protein